MKTIPVVAVIDDDESVREAIANLLRSSGYMAETFESAIAFLNSSSLQHTECLILDVQMPVMSGIELQHYLSLKGPHIPIIFISDYRDEKIRTKAFKAGAIDFLNKPFCEASLVQRIQSVLHSVQGLHQRPA